MTPAELEQNYKGISPSTFTPFITTVRRAVNAGEISPLGVSCALGNIADSEMATCRSIGRKGEMMSEDERQRLIMSAKIVAFCLILLCESRSKKETRRRVLLLIEYSAYLNNFRYALAEFAVKCASYAMTSPGFTWTMVESAIGIEVFIYKMLSNARFDETQKLDGLYIDGAGSVSLEGGLLHISSARLGLPDVKAFTGHNEAVEVCSRNIRDERLKDTGLDDVGAVDSFASIFIQAQDESRKQVRIKPKKQLVVGEKYSIVLEKPEEDGIDCLPIGVDYDGSCEVKEEELAKGLFTHELTPYLFEQDCIEGAELVDEEEPPLFSIRETYKAYCRRLAEQDRNSGRAYQAKIIDIYKGASPDKDRYRLISDKGYAGLMRINGEYRAGDVITAYTVYVNSLGNDLFINMDEAAPDYGDCVGKFDKDNILGDFVVTEKDALKAIDRNKENENPASSGDAEMLKQIATILYLSKPEGSMSHFRDLLTSAFIMNTAEDIASRNWLLARAEFIGLCLRAAEGRPVTEKRMPDGLTEKEKRLIHSLSFLDKPEDTVGIAGLIQKAETDDEMKIARLLMLYSLSMSNPDDIKKSREDIRGQICKVLGVRDHFRGTDVKGGGKYGNGELSNVEFKSSYVMSNVDGKPDLFRQGRGQVFEAVCGFMNKDGGTVYIGVNNYGDPLTAKGYGLNGDLEWFLHNFDTVKMLRTSQLGHPVPQPEDLDSYCRFLNDEVELYFKPSVRNCITISPTEDMDAIRIDVKPSEFEIVKLYEDNSWSNGTIYVRNGEETLPMSRHDQEQRLMKLRSVGKVEQFIITLGEAIDKKRKVILKGYASSNSNEVKDRFVVPINLVYNNENLWAYDLEKKEAKEFRLSRITAIETDIEDAAYPHAFKKGEADIFRWINPKVNYHIKLKMTIAALNNLREEYSITKNLPEGELYQVSPQRWILDTTLHGLSAVKRFYLGLADQIEIMDTEDSDKLKEEIRSFTDRFIC